MIGVINRDKIFEFRDESELCDSLSIFAERYGSESMIIVDTSDRIKAVIYNNQWVFQPNLIEDTKYYLYGASPRAINFNDLQRNDIIPNLNSWIYDGLPFAFTTQRIPKTLDLY